MAGTHQWIDLYNDIKAVDDFIAVEGEIVSVNPYTNTATVLLPRWGTVPDIPIFYHCQGNTDVNIGHRAFRKKDIAVVIVLNGRTLEPPINARFASFLTSSMKIVGHGKHSGRETIKQPYSCRWEDFTFPWYITVNGVLDATHPASEKMEEALCIKHKWDFNGIICPTQQNFDDDLVVWGPQIDATKGPYLWVSLTTGDVYLEWKSLDSWEGDDPKEADMVEISVERTGYHTIGSNLETYARIIITDDLGNVAKIYLYNDEYVLNPSSLPAQTTEYETAQDIIVNPLTNYNIFGRVSEVKIEAAARSASGNSIDLRLFHIDFY